MSDQKKNWIFHSEGEDSKFWKKRKAAKKHICESCQKEILKGSEYYHFGASLNMMRLISSSIKEQSGKDQAMIIKLCLDCANKHSIGMN